MKPNQAQIDSNHRISGVDDIDISGVSRVGVIEINEIGVAEVNDIRVARPIGIVDEADIDGVSREIGEIDIERPVIRKASEIRPGISNSDAIDTRAAI